MKHLAGTFALFSFLLTTCILTITYISQNITVQGSAIELCLQASTNQQQRNCLQRLDECSATIRCMEWLALGLGLAMIMLGTYMVVHLDQQHKHMEMIGQWWGKTGGGGGGRTQQQPEEGGAAERGAAEKVSMIMV